MNEYRFLPHITGPADLKKFEIPVKTHHLWGATGISPLLLILFNNDMPSSPSRLNFVQFTDDSPDTE